ncbi:MAG TPA: hypothetical protein VJH06_03565 [Candidatus Paceibacterota bacterium]
MGKIPEGLIKCGACGEYKGKVIEDDEEGYIGVSCLCDGIPCPKCKINKIHRPISNSYDEINNSIGHWPYFSGMMPCNECKNIKKE